MSRICARCGKNLDLVGTAHNCLPVLRVVGPIVTDVIDIDGNHTRTVRYPQPKPEKKIKRKR